MTAAVSSTPKLDYRTSLDAALDYASRGWHVLPLHNIFENTAGLRVCTCNGTVCEKKPGKHPKTPHGFHDATADVSAVRSLWQKSLGGNIGVRCGTVSGLVDIEIDIADGKPGVDALAEAESRCGKLPETRMFRSGSGGVHRLFAYPHGENVYIKSRAGFEGLTGLDVRADGGYFVAPPSNHLSGGVYEWLNDAPLAELPATWVEALRTKEPKPVRVGTVDAPADVEATGTYWTQRAIDTAENGTRHECCVWLVRQLWDAGLEVEDAERFAVRYAQAVDELGGGFPESEALECVRWVSGTERRGPAMGLERRERWETIDAALDKAVEAKDTKPLLDVKDDIESLGRNDWHVLLGKLRNAGFDEQHIKDFQQEIDPHAYTMTEQGNAERLVARHGSKLRWCGAWKSWLLYDGKRWVVDENEAVMGYAKETVKSILEEAKQASDSADTKALTRHALASLTEHGLRAMVNLAKSELPITVEQLDNPDHCRYLLNAQNGTLDLKTGRLREHRPDDFITKLAPVVYDASALCPTFDAFLSTIMQGNSGLVDYLQRFIGSVLTGDTSDQIVSFFYGSGSNGKSTLIEAISDMLGDYAVTTPVETIMAKEGNGGVPNDVARLKGARFVYTVETEQGKRLAESRLKQMTGGDKITARFMRAEWFEFRPEYKLCVATNHQPFVRGTDEGIWRRIRLVPFNAHFADGQKDRQLPAKLRAELAGMLAWAVRGCMAWQQSGLPEIKDITDATKAYRSDMDIIGGFITDECDVEQEAANVLVKDLYQCYQDWCEEAGEYKLTKRQFNAQMRERGFVDERGTGNKSVWKGIKLKSEEASPKLLTYKQPTLAQTSAPAAGGELPSYLQLPTSSITSRETEKAPLSEKSVTLGNLVTPVPPRSDIEADVDDADAFLRDFLGGDDDF